MIFAIGCMFFPGQNLADEALLPSDHGYMLIRVILTTRERVDLLAMSNVDTKEEIRIHGDSFESAGLNAWAALVAVPSGRYFWSEYRPSYGISTSEVQRLADRHRRSGSGSASNAFEIVAGAVNYVGDWTMRVDSSQQKRLKPTVEFEKSTLEHYVTQYPEYSNKYQIYLSVIGEEAISLIELAKKTE